ncbi:AAA family ATPase [Anaerobacillus alkalilacustris]|uniref:AAA family ATPase n=1 Tax=Anaerobacillus alkalilacustris TaxID=393763 RepID=A0A1S2LS12_9BACI|nr:MoxR family ATPase [Anaerobacillus alkalilacustris]OIJ15319.1 AAA family ATPase [Anaerobacillus alkalilacustris]
MYQNRTLSEKYPLIDKVIDNVEKVVVGKQKEVTLSLVALLSGGHVLLEDVPGVGKTMMVRAIAKSIGANYKRIQFTPDLLPSDVTGISIYDQKVMDFKFRPGPIMANVVLADEINRTSPKTQAALLEALEEASVTIDGETRLLEKPFFVMATQNPIEYGGTYPLPEAQLDRFLFKFKIGYPTPEEEMEVLTRVEKQHPIEKIEAVLSLEDLLQMQKEVTNVYVDNLVKSYIISIINETRSHQSVYLGVSPRGSIALMKAAQSYAYIQGREYVIPDDIKYLAEFVLSHRVILNSDSKYANLSPQTVVKEILQYVKIPVKKEAIR